MSKIASVAVTDLRFPTSQLLDGSDAMNPDPDYSAACLQLKTDDDELTGSSFVFTIGRGNDLQANAVEMLARSLIGREVDSLCEDPFALNRQLAWDSQLRWLGPDKGVVHMATGAIVNAVWDLRARRLQQPLWQCLASLSPGEIVGLVDWTYLGDFLDPGRAREMLEDQAKGREQRITALREHGLGAYTTSPGWLGYSDDKLVRLCIQAADQGFNAIKLKVGADADQDNRRLSLARGAVGKDMSIAVDANQRWSVSQAIAAVKDLSAHNLLWVEEPTHPDDMVGHAAIAKAISPIPVATGEHLANPVMAKQLLQLGGAQILQIDATRVGGAHELIALLLLARQAGATVIPHAGGIGLCEAVQHYAFFNAIAVAADTDRLMVEYVDHLHEHMEDPVRIDHGRYRLPAEPGSSTAIRQGALDRFSYPHGAEWTTLR